MLVLVEGCGTAEGLVDSFEEPFNSCHSSFRPTPEIYGSAWLNRLLYCRRRRMCLERWGASQYLGGLLRLRDEAESWQRQGTDAVDAECQSRRHAARPLIGDEGSGRRDNH